MEVRWLGQFHPSRLESWSIGQEFRACACVPLCCRQSSLEIRYPAPHRPANADTWHRDLGEPQCQHLVMWSNEQSTQVLTTEAEMIQFQPFDVIWVDNLGPLHRMPPEADCTTRWFLVFRCSGD